MKLTLRTLLAWLDDTLPPSEVRQIGQLVSETPIAKELEERIHRVSRQRRLIVPNATGPEGADANVVAAYLDNVLDPHAVTEYEKLCLTSDVNLAEVASSHQILSILKQKAKVPPEARARMYHLIKGREATGETPPRAMNGAKPIVSAPIPLWTPPEMPKRSLVERFGPLAVVASLIFVLCWSAWMSLKLPSEPATSPLAALNPKIPPAPPLGAPKQPLADPIPDDPDPPAAPRDTKAAPPPVEPAPAIPVVAAPSNLPPGAAGIVGHLDGILFRYNPESRVWDRLAEAASLRDGDRIVNLSPFQSALQIGFSKLSLIGNTELTVKSAGEGTGSRFEMSRGRIRITGSENAEPIAIAFGADVITLRVPLGTVLGLESLAGPKPDPANPVTSSIQITTVEGSATATVGDASETLKAGETAILKRPEGLVDLANHPLPPWLAEPIPSAVDLERGKLFSRFFKPDKPTLLCLLEASEDDNAGVRRNAVNALGVIGSLELVVSTMSKRGDPESRREAIAILRDVASRDPESAKNLRSLLIQTGGSEEWADKVLKLLKGYSEQDAADETTGTKLVGLLKETEDVGVRELAIEALQRITKQGDRLGYDPDKPHDPAGIKAWQDLLQRRDPKIPPAPKPR